MNELEMIKAFAELRGIGVHLEMEGKSDEYWYSEEISKEYNPITDLSLTFKAMVEYDVDVIISEGLVEIDGEHVTFYQKDSLLPKAIIECILKSRGLYK